MPQSLMKEILAPADGGGGRKWGGGKDGFSKVTVFKGGGKKVQRV